MAEVCTVEIPHPRSRPVERAYPYRVAPRRATGTVISAFCGYWPPVDHRDYIRIGRLYVRETLRLARYKVIFYSGRNCLLAGSIRDFRDMNIKRIS